MKNTINIVADTHDVPALEAILSKLDNVFSLGDIVAVDTKEYLENVSRYSRTWKAHTNNDFTGTTTEDLRWFHDLNINGWKRQLDMIKASNKELYVTRGNSDYRMLKYFSEMRSSLEKSRSENPKLHFVEEPFYLLKDNLGIIFLPYIDDEYYLDDLLNSVDSKYKRLLVLGHCPLFKEHEKSYYVHHYRAVQAISEKLGSLTYFHGHVHSENTYRYYLSDLEHVEIITPKAEDCDQGMGYNHHYLEVDTITGNITARSVSDDSPTPVLELPLSYMKSDHWNNYVKPQT